MKKILSTIFIICLCQGYLFSQPKDNNPTFQVIYAYTEDGKSSVIVDDSIELITVQGADISRKKVPNGKFRDILKLSMEVKTTGNTDSSVINISNMNSYDITKLNVPDKLIFKENKWFTLKTSHISEIPFIETILLETDLHKKILGYDCKKVIARELISNNSFEVWVTDMLPSTLIPGAGFRPFPGAVLEMNFPSSRTRFVAKSVKKVHN